MAINLSAASLADESLARHIERRLQDSSLPAQSIGFEITETGAVRDLNLARAFILRMRALGCSVALDDFGAGYCSFAYLRHLPVDVLRSTAASCANCRTPNWPSPWCARWLKSPAP